MDSSTPRSDSPAVVSPAGTLEKLRYAVAYGADEVYFGGTRFNLRSQAGNLTAPEIAQGLDFCRDRGVKSIFLLNSFLHEGDVEDARRYVREIRHFRFDAVMVSDPGMLLLLREEGVGAPLHLSTQMSTLNHLAVKFWRDMGVERIVLAREVTLDEIRRIRGQTDARIEVFAHGALCISYSGRCLLSRYLAGRDANAGSCAHPCRWRYALVEEKRPGARLEIVEHGSGTEILSSRDLCLLERLPDYAEAGVDAFKIEGRMKSLYYAANTTRVYKHALRTCLEGGDYGALLPFWMEELELVSHRPYTADLFRGDGFEGGTPYIRKADFLGCWETPGGDVSEAYMHAFNPVFPGESVEAIFPIDGGTVKDGPYRVEEIREDEKSVAMAQPGKVYLIRFDKEIYPFAILRRRIDRQ